ncbi:A disintegrin and metalloproteinase with thrombospondin motifs 18 [Plakobranchus ocellatus]|uniref:A disintegrin and metalloproteinase with thrombospondin motifs 18 n=1 Tax=Plakobranchus ocellatus TaxID=259542 RepID=A0AAV4DAW5_9GAST|nr:A disintegrin and metalloproteinase with thrombospondin motifs 18 [Plakobranchus ocellatus]
MWAAWNGWSECSRACGLGRTFRDRTCTDPSPIYGGDSCGGQGSEHMACYSGPCQDELHDCHVSILASLVNRRVEVSAKVEKGGEMINLRYPSLIGLKFDITSFSLNTLKSPKTGFQGKLAAARRNFKLLRLFQKPNKTGRGMPITSHLVKKFILVTVSAQGNEGEIRLNDGDAIQVNCPAGETYFPRTSIYVGGAGPKDWLVLTKLIKGAVFFSGMIDTLSINGWPVTYKMATLVGSEGDINSLGYSFSGAKEAHDEWIGFIFIIVILAVCVCPALCCYITKEHPCWDWCRDRWNRERDDDIDDEDREFDEKAPLQRKIQPRKNREPKTGTESESEPTQSRRQRKTKQAPRKVDSDQSRSNNEGISSESRQKKLKPSRERARATTGKASEPNEPSISSVDLSDEQDGFPTSMEEPPPPSSKRSATPAPKQHSAAVSVSTKRSAAPASTKRSTTSAPTKRSAPSETAASSAPAESSASSAPLARSAGSAPSATPARPPRQARPASRARPPHEPSPPSQALASVNTFGVKLQKKDKKPATEHTQERPANHPKYAKKGGGEFPQRRTSEEWKRTSEERELEGCRHPKSFAELMTLRMPPPRTITNEKTLPPTDPASVPPPCPEPQPPREELEGFIPPIDILCNPYYIRGSGWQHGDPRMFPPVDDEKARDQHCLKRCGNNYVLAMNFRQDKSNNHPMPSSILTTKSEDRSQGSTNDWNLQSWQSGRSSNNTETNTPLHACGVATNCGLPNNNEEQVDEDIEWEAFALRRQKMNANI